MKSALKCTLLLEDMSQLKPLIAKVGYCDAVLPDFAMYWTLGNFSKPVATISLPKPPTFLGNFCKGVKMFHFSSELIFGQLL